MLYAVKDLHTIAGEARSAFESGQVTVDMLIGLYSNIENRRVQDLGRLAVEIDYLLPYFPYQNCEYASVYLGSQVGQGQMLCGYYDFRPHKVWDVGPVVGETIMDITADQFGGPPIYIGPLVLPWCE
jgi:hypothetical protein